MRTVAAGVVLLLVAVSGCSSDEAAPVEVGPAEEGTAASGSASPDSSSSAAPPTASATARAPVGVTTPNQPPKAALAATPEGASAFVRYYITLINDAFASADASAVRKVSHPECEGCLNLIEAIEAPSDIGERVEGGDLRVAFAEGRHIAPGDVLVDIRYSVEPVRVLNAAGTVEETRPGTAAIDGQLRLVMESYGWTVRGFRNTVS